MKSIDDDQFEQLVGALPLTAAGRRDRVLLAVMFDAGLRCDEALALLPSDLEIRGDGDYWIHVRHGKGRREGIKDDGDTCASAGIGKERFIPIDSELGELIEAWIEDPDRPQENEVILADQEDSAEKVAYLFPVLASRKAGKSRGPIVRGGRLTTRQIRQRMKTLSEEAEVFITIRDPDNRKKLKQVTVSPHALRHSYAIRLIRGGALLPTVQEQLGHQNLTTTQRYLKFSDPERAGQVRGAIAAAREKDSKARKERLEKLDREGFGLEVFERLSPSVRGTLTGAVNELGEDELLAKLAASD